MIFSVQQGHCLSDAAQCVAVSAGDLSVRGHRWYTAGIWDEIITALVLIEAFIPGVIRAKQTTLGSSKTQLGLWGELWAEMQCAASSLSAETNTWWKSLISLPVAATNCLYFVQDYYGFFWRNIIGYNIQILCGLWKKKKSVWNFMMDSFTWDYYMIPLALFTQRSRNTAADFPLRRLCFFTKRCWLKGRTTMTLHPHPMPSLHLLYWTARKDSVAIFQPWTGCVK